MDIYCHGLATSNCINLDVSPVSDRIPEIGSNVSVTHKHRLIEDLGWKRPMRSST